LIESAMLSLGGAVTEGIPRGGGTRASGRDPRRLTHVGGAVTCGSVPERAATQTRTLQYSEAIP
jgi:hypothetical protein